MPSQRVNYPEPGDWVVATHSMEFCCRWTVDRPGFDKPFAHNHYVGMPWAPGTVEEGKVGRLIREDWDYSYQSAHDCIVYIVDFGDGQERWCSFGDVVGVSLLDQMAKEINRG
jgi:hypothetical protein